MIAFVEAGREKKANISNNEKRYLYSPYSDRDNNLVRIIDIIKPDPIKNIFPDSIQIPCFLK